MPTRSRPTFVALVLFLVLALASPVGAADSLSSAREKREAARRKRAELATRLNHLKASDAQLSAAVNVLTRQVTA